MGEMAEKRKMLAIKIKALGSPVCSKDECSPLDIRIVYFIWNVTCIKIYPSVS